MINENKINNESVTSLVAAMKDLADLESKVYISINNEGKFITKIDKEYLSKKDKGIKAEKLVQTIEKTIEFIKKKIPFENNSYINHHENLKALYAGLDNLKNRIKTHKENRGFIAKLFFTIFNKLDKTEEVLNKIDKIKTDTLNWHISQLEGLKNQIQQKNVNVIEKVEKGVQEAGNVLKQFGEAVKKFWKGVSEGKGKDEKTVPSQVEEPKNTEAQWFEQEITKLKSINPDDTIKVIPTHEPSKIFDLPEGVKSSPASFQLMGRIKQELGITKPEQKGKIDSNQNEEFQRKLIFGFSVGRRKEAGALTKLAEEKYLEKLLEGGNGTTNMYYLAHFLENKIKQAKKGEDPNYISKLKQLQADINRSLKFAFRTFLFESVEANNPKRFETLSQDITKELKQMKPGERLLLPIGTSEHDTLLSIEKNKEGKAAITFYNTGQGVGQGFFEFSTGATAQRFKPVEIDGIQGMLKAVLSNRKNNGSIEDLENHLKQTLGEPSEKESGKIQVSGVCSFQALYVAAKDILQPPKTKREGQSKTVRLFKNDLLNYIQKDFSDMVLKLEQKPKKTEEEETNLNIYNQLLVDNQKEIKSNKKKLQNLG